ncbi:NADP-dependent 3-hydroxy acid dehydrogenase YdfG [Pedococcus cremeus]|uniref:NADP-dependent 3-hydroxy acid dehydrogenase YdfG n=1 Tax=Pedococcus cremeus TaxID=587636 RepID=A0A1H9UU22_9MICO|nr:SDR family NAD(P)-dependent oxidoreductase [Pedococcus cremeus]SES12644.1 NADP-dependent 3-hydroxy acid dehydrogenase YdfG [Pedococcus cremeus]
MSDRLDGRVAIVTGAASGIGRAIALRMAAEGAVVIAADRNVERLEGLKGEDTMPGQVVHVAGDLTTTDGIDAVVMAAGAHGGADILVNNAGVMDWFLPAGDVDDATWETVMAVNVTAPMRLMRAVLPGMLAQGRGAIVNVASVAGITGAAAGLAYTASKHALVGMTRNTAYFYGPQGVRTNVVCPGGVETHIAEGGAVPRLPWTYERLQANFGRAQRTAQPDEIASLVLWLAGDEAVNVNGAVIASDGGWSAA